MTLTSSNLRHTNTQNRLLSASMIYVAPENNTTKLITQPHNSYGSCLSNKVSFLWFRANTRDHHTCGSSSRALSHTELMPANVGFENYRLLTAWNSSVFTCIISYLPQSANDTLCFRTVSPLNQPPKLHRHIIFILRLVAVITNEGNALPTTGGRTANMDIAITSITENRWQISWIFHQSAHYWRLSISTAWTRDASHTTGDM